MSNTIIDKSKFKPIYSQKLAAYLMLRGFVLLNMEKNKDNSGRNVFFFNNSNQLEDATNEYFKNKNDKKPIIINL